jgi:hypothetical protein
LERLNAAPRAGAEALGLVGLLVLAGCSLAADPTRFPFPWAVPVVLASVALIAVTVARRDLFVNRFLSSVPMVAIGKVSYSLYLWHWPVFVLFRWTTGLETAVQKVLALAIVVSMAAASYMLVEQPVLRAKRVQRLPSSAAALGGLVLISLAAVVSGSMFLSQRFFSMSVVSRSADWAINRTTHPAEASFPCKVTTEDARIDDVPLYALRPRDCDPAQGVMYAAGDSHAGAYILMLRIHAAMTGQEVLLVTKGGCAVFDLKTTINPATGCGAYASTLMTMLDRRVKQGDVVFLPSLRVPRFTGQAGPVPKSSQGMSREAIEQAITQIRPWVARGARVVFAAPTPIFRTPAFRCADWFNADNPVCRERRDITRAEMEDVRRSALEALLEVAARSGAQVWDPLPHLCDSQVCRPGVDGRPLFFDGDHLSGYGNLVLLPSFERFICRESTVARCAAP